MISVNGRLGKSWPLVVSCAAGRMFGVLAIDKPSGWTSRDVVNRIQKVIRPTKVGHTGTLDPMATGVLLLPVGPATRLTEFAHAMPKCYEADFLLGSVSDTLDATGRVGKLSDASVVHRDQWLAEMSKWRGVVRQRPPIYSAIHVDGQRAYDLARRGEPVEMPTREVTIHELELLDFDFPKVSLRVRCSTGTYIRCLGADMAAALGSGAIMTRLVRTQIGPFTLANCFSLEEMESREAIAGALVSPLGLLSGMSQVTLNDEQCRRVQHGQSIRIAELSTPLASSSECIAAIDSAGNLAALLKPNLRELQPIRVFPLAVS